MGPKKQQEVTPEFQKGLEKVKNQLKQHENRLTKLHKCAKENCNKIELARKGLEGLGGSNDSISIQLELKKIEEVIISGIQNHIDENASIKDRIESLEKRIKLLHFNTSGGNNENSENDQMLILLVRDQLALLQEEVIRQICEKTEAVEKRFSLKIETLESNLACEQEKNQIIENRLLKLESLYHDNSSKSTAESLQNVSKSQHSIGKKEQEKTKKTAAKKKTAKEATENVEEYVNKQEKKKALPRNITDDVDKQKQKKDAVTQKTLDKVAKQNTPDKLDKREVKESNPINQHFFTRMNSSAPETKELRFLPYESTETLPNNGNLSCQASLIVDLPFEETAASSQVSSFEQSCYLEKARKYLSALQIDHNNATHAEEEKQQKPKDGFINGCELLKQPIMQDAPMDWVLRKQKETSVVVIQHSGTYYTNNPGYRVQFRAQIDRMHGDIYFSIRILKGLFDDYLQWPFSKRFRVSVSKKTEKGTSDIGWTIPTTALYKQNIRKPLGKNDLVYTEWMGPFDISKYIERKKIGLEIKIL